MTSSTTLDASALLAYLLGEAGADTVAEAITNKTYISTVNLSEALTRLTSKDLHPKQLVETMTRDGLLNHALQVEPFSTNDAIEAARLRPLTQKQGLSFADRACLAVASRLSTPVLTADRAWDSLDLETEVRLIR